ncbi:hypothetical protein TNCV_665211 [Trichonephila clavipes]|uniref:Uncharacterized protein n=1 Tax=Trichonephila clavipes TaxID=2585209 RepID=A0A8X6SK62_TRICX|nr:hypothetical protein TNCV_665211 [Trichonephila clavipes]
MCCAMVRYVTERSVTAMRTIYVKWFTEVDAIDHVGPSYPPASSSHISSLQLFGFIQHDYRFPCKIIHNLGRPLSFLCRSRILDQKLITVFYEP